MRENNITLTNQMTEGGWTNHPTTSVRYYSKPKMLWGYELTDYTGEKFFIGFNRKKDAVAAEEFLARWDGRGDVEQSILNDGFNPEGYKGVNYRDV